MVGASIVPAAVRGILASIGHGSRLFREKLSLVVSPAFPNEEMRDVPFAFPKVEGFLRVANEAAELLAVGRPEPRAHQAGCS